MRAASCGLCRVFVNLCSSVDLVVASMVQWFLSLMSRFETSRPSVPEVIPSAILRVDSSAYDVSFLGPRHLLTGTTTGSIEIWVLDDRRIGSSRPSGSSSVLSVHGLGRGSECLSQGRDGVSCFWDSATHGKSWVAPTGSGSFAKALIMLPEVKDPLDAEPAECLS